MKHLLSLFLTILTYPCACFGEQASFSFSLNSRHSQNNTERSFAPWQLTQSQASRNASAQQNCYAASTNNNIQLPSCRNYFKQNRRVLARMETSEKEQRGINIHPEFKEAALAGKEMIDGGRRIIDSIEHIGITEEEANELLKLLWETMGGKETLKKLGLEGAIIDTKFIKHFTSPEIKTIISRAGNVSKSLSGGHVLDPTLLEKGIIEFEATTNGIVKEGILRCQGICKPGKTTFPLHWTKKESIVNVAKSIRKLAEKEITIPQDDRGYFIDTLINKTIKVTTKLSQNMRFKTSYPEL